MTGANRIRASPDLDDGILTAEEISTLDLRSVEWVVLSGCNTGLGRVRPGEGVIGLPRAFALAGVRTTIMSLWPVEDIAARQWMECLYDAKIKGKSAVEAIRDADLAILSRLRSRGQSAVTRWAAFVGTGNWR
jgi:CHAT domain-containing protein